MSTGAELPKLSGVRNPDFRVRRAGLAALLIGAAGFFAGCEPLAITAMGVGASTGVAHTLNGINYRTFTAPAPRVRVATMAALKRMGIKVESVKKVEGGESIKAATPDRQIEIELESISASATRMRAVAKQGSLLYDSATATEIILQTEKLLNGNA